MSGGRAGVVQTTREYDGSHLQVQYGTEDLATVSVGLDTVSSIKLDETKLTNLLRLASALKFEKSRGDGRIYGLVPFTWTATSTGENQLTAARKAFVTAYVNPVAGEEVPVPFAVMEFHDLLKLPAAKAFKRACSTGQEVTFGQAFLLAVTIASLEGGNLELSAFTTDTAKEHFTIIASGSSVERSTPGSRMLQALDQSKISEAQADLKALCSLYCEYVWLSTALLSDPKAYAQTAQGLHDLIVSYVANCLPEGKPPIRVSAEYCLRFKLLTAQEKNLVLELLETNCFGNLSSSASALGKHAEAVRVIKERISLHKNRALFLKRKGGPERAAAISRLVPAFREDAI